MIKSFDPLNSLLKSAREDIIICILERKQSQRG